MPDGPVGAYNNKIVCNQRVTMKLALFPIFADVVVPLYLSSFLVECANQAIARANDKKVARDRGRGEDSAAGIEFPKERSVRGRYGCIPHLGREKAGKEQKNCQS